MKRERASCLLVLGVLAAAGPALATDGYFANGGGTQNKAMGGADVALAPDTQAPCHQPGGGGLSRLALAELLLRFLARATMS